MDKKAQILKEFADDVNKRISDKRDIALYDKFWQDSNKKIPVWDPLTDELIPLGSIGKLEVVIPDEFRMRMGSPINKFINP